MTAVGLSVTAWLVLRTPEVPGRPAHPPYLTYFLIDGLTQSVFRQELAAGRLPNLARLVEEGTYVENGIAAFPSMTAYGFYPFITGRDAAASGVLGLRWLDRRLPLGPFRNYVGRTSRAMNGDFAPSPPTVFERFPGQHSATFNSYANRGAVRREMLGWDFSMAKYQEHSRVVRALSRVPLLGPSLFPNWYRAESNVVDRAILDLKRRPKVQWITFAGPDGRHHIAGMDGTYVALVRHIDGLIGRYRAASRRLGQEDQRLYAVISDHGLTEVKENVDLRRPLELAGLRAWRGEATHLLASVPREPWAVWKDQDAVIAINGNTLAHVYLRNPAVPGEGGWRTPPSAAVLRTYPRQGGGGRSM